MSDYVTGFQTASGIKKYDYNSLANLPESGSDATNTVISPNADYAEVGEWVDGNPDRENRLGYFIAIAEVGDNTIKIRKATSTDDIRGVSVYNPAFSGNASRDKYGEDGELLPQYNYIGLMGIVNIIDEGRCTVGGRCISNDDGIAVPSPNNMGYAVLERVDNRHVLIAIEPGADMIQRVKTDIVDIDEQLKRLNPSTEGLRYAARPPYEDDAGCYGVNIGASVEGDVIIASEYEGLPVAYIGNNAFSNRSSITSITIPNTVTSIGTYAFSNCTGLTSVVIPESMIEIKSGAFSGCSSLKSIIIPKGIYHIRDRVFSDCTNLTDVYYAGTKSQFDGIVSKSFNDPLFNATIHYNYISDFVTLSDKLGDPESLETESKEVVGAINELNEKVNEGGGSGGGSPENAVLSFTVSTDIPTTMSAIITAIQDGGGDISRYNYVQLTGYLTRLLLMQFQHYGGNTYKVNCNDVENGYKIYSASTDNVCSVTSKRISEFLEEGKPSATMPQIRFANFQKVELWDEETETLSTRYRFTVENLGGGTLQVGDKLQICCRRKYPNGKKKLRRMADIEITENDLNQRFLKIEVDPEDESVEKWLFRNDRNQSSVTTLSAMYFRLKRVTKYSDSDGKECNAIFSNVEQVWKTYILPCNGGWELNIK